MGLSISGSVGERGTNRRADIEVVQPTLKKSGANLGVDRQCGPRTIAAIKTFQSAFMKTPDGRVDVGATTWKRLVEAGGSGSAPPMPDSKRNELIIAAIDRDADVCGAGITLI